MSVHIPYAIVTVQELVLALSTYPPDAQIVTEENGGGYGTIECFEDGAHWVVYDGWTCPVPRGPGS